MSFYIVHDRDRHVIRIEDDYDKLQGLPEHINWISNWDVGTFEEAVRLAGEATAVTEEVYLPCDRSSSVSPRYGIIRAPKLGEPVSYSFNGDTTPCGVISKISDSYYRIQTTTGKVFYRRHHTSSWIMQGGTWSMVSGHYRERNPSF